MAFQNCTCSSNTIFLEFQLKYFRDVLSLSTILPLDLSRQIEIKSLKGRGYFHSYFITSTFYTALTSTLVSFCTLSPTSYKWWKGGGMEDGSDSVRNFECSVQRVIGSGGQGEVCVATVRKHSVQRSC